MFKVPPSIAIERLNICKACKHFKVETQSCGTIILGDKLSPEDLAEAEANNEITHYRKKLRLCGCFMPVKTKYSLFRCPINKWGRYKLNETEADALREFVLGLPTQGIYTAEIIKEASEWFTKITGQRQGCSSCKARMIIDYLKETVNVGTWDDSEENS